MIGASGNFWKTVPTYPVAITSPDFETAIAEISISCPLKNYYWCLSCKFSKTSSPPML